MSKVMSWSTNWPTKVNPDVSFGFGFSLDASLRSFWPEELAGLAAAALPWSHPGGRAAYLTPGAAAGS